MIFWSLLAKSFVRILSTLLSREIGLKSLGEVGFSTLGIKVMNEEFILSNDTFYS
jgi:hypothetical protein